SPLRTIAPGNTVTRKMLSGLSYPTSGAARVLAYVPWERKYGYRRQFALLLGQKKQLWWDLPELLFLAEQQRELAPIAVLSFPRDVREDSGRTARGIAEAGKHFARHSVARCDRAQWA